MASLMPGYEYDIFISYRHNDNLDGWVSAFVQNLEKELRGTIKEPVSVYFDTNPHDGLLETHNVDKSLEGKLKCLIFIPIISQTYFDSKCFAWQHEFCAFNKLAKEDQFGRDIRLAGGNVASRILPVKIHDLDPEDQKLYEDETEGILRGIEFIYKEPGVNRPLSPNDDAKENLNRTQYKNQVNKVANAVKEIIGGLKNPSSSIAIPATKDSSSISKSNPEPFESIAVLPFANMSSDPEQEFFSDGISEEIINMLAQVTGLKVAGRTSSFSFKWKNQDLRLIGEQLNVNHILEGSVRKSGNKIRITAQLIKVADGYHLWSEKYDRQLEDIFDIQDEISLAILNAIKMKLLRAAKEAVLKRYTDNAQAYQVYLQGRFYFNKYTKHGYEKAIEHFEAAIKIEPKYALAYAYIAYTYILVWIYNYLLPEKCLPQMKQAAEHSLQLDDEIAESHLAMAMMKINYEWDFAVSAVEFKKAIELNPNLADAHLHFAIHQVFLGKYTEAIKHASIAYNLDPFSLNINMNVAFVFMMMGDYKKEVEYGRRLVELEPNFYGGHILVGGGLIGLKKYEEAVSEIEKAVQLNFGSVTLFYLGLLYGAMGEKVKARKALGKMENLRITQSVGYCNFGIVYMALGEFDNAFQYFEKAIEKHEGLMLWLKGIIRLFPEFEQDPRTKQLLERIGLP